MESSGRTRRPRPLLVTAAAAAAAVTVAGCNGTGAPATASVRTGRPFAAVVTKAATSAGSPTAPGSPRPAPQPLHGKVVVLDPGHNRGNFTHPDEINRLVNALTLRKACDTTGTETDDGYLEADFTWDVAVRAQRLLRARGATVVLTRTPATPWGPCITDRAAIGNRAHAAAAVSVHADGGPASGYGFHVIAPANVGPNAAIVAPSRTLALILRADMHRVTGEPYATYIASDGLAVRSDLGGLNLSTVPKVFIECGNMRNAADAARLKSPAFRQAIAVALTDALTSFVDRGR